MEEPCRGREREDRGNSWDERGGGGGGKRGIPAFCSNFLERQTQTNSIRQLKGEKREERVGGEPKHDLILDRNEQKRECKAWIYIWI